MDVVEVDLPRPTSGDEEHAALRGSTHARTHPGRRASRGCRPPTSRTSPPRCTGGDAPATGAQRRRPAARGAPRAAEIGVRVHRRRADTLAQPRRLRRARARPASCATWGRSTPTTALGQRVAVPFLAAPTGLADVRAPQRGGRRRARRPRRGVDSTRASGASTRTPEEVAAAATGASPWFQLYLRARPGPRPGSFSRACAKRDSPRSRSPRTSRSPAAAQRPAQRLHDPASARARMIAQGLTKPRWSRAGSAAAACRSAAGASKGAVAFASRVNAQMDPTLTWRRSSGCAASGHGRCS